MKNTIFISIVLFQYAIVSCNQNKTPIANKHKADSFDLIIVSPIGSKTIICADKWPDTDRQPYTDTIAGTVFKKLIQYDTDSLPYKKISRDMYFSDSSYSSAPSWTDCAYVDSNGHVIRNDGYDTIWHFFRSGCHPKNDSIGQDDIILMPLSKWGYGNDRGDSTFIEW